MALRDGTVPYRARRVTWVDQSEGAQLALNEVAFDDIDETLGAVLPAGDPNVVFEDNHEWPPPPPPLPPREWSTRQTLSPILQQTLPMSPTGWRGSSAKGMHQDHDKEKLDDTKPHDKHATARDCQSKITQNADHDAMMTTFVGRMDEAPLVDDDFATAYVHTSSCALSPDFSQSICFHGRTTRKASVNSPTTLFMHHHEERALYEARQGISPLRDDRHASARSLSPETVPVPSRLKEGRTSCYTARRGRLAFSPSPLSPRPFAVFRSKKRGYNKTRAPSHSSTAIHGPRSRCGCQGVTVQVDSGPLGFSLVSGYRIEGGLMLKQVWSDCDTDSGAFRHSVEVQRHVHGERDYHGHVGALDVRFVGRLESSGLIKVQTVGSQFMANTSVTEPPFPLRPGVTVGSSLAGNKAQGVVLAAGVGEVEKGDILVRVDHVQVSKKSFDEVVFLLNRAKRPTRLAFVRHACGRRFLDRDKGGGGGPGVSRQQHSAFPPVVMRWGCGMSGKLRFVHEKSTQAGLNASINPVASSRSPPKWKKQVALIEAEPHGCPVSALLRTRRSLRRCGMEEWHEVVAGREHLWQTFLEDLPIDSHSDRDKLRRLTNGSRSLMDDGVMKGQSPGLSKRRLVNNYERFVSSEVFRGVAARSKSDESTPLTVRVWKDVARTMAGRRPCRPGSSSTALPGAATYACPVQFVEGSQDALFRVVYATCSTLQFVSGMSYMAAVMLVNEPVEAAAYATLVTLLKGQIMRKLYPLSDIDLLDAYHLCEGRVVTYRTYGAGRNSGIPSAGIGIGAGYRDSARGNSCSRSRCESGVTSELANFSGTGSANYGGGDDARGRTTAPATPTEGEEEAMQQVVVGKALPRLVCAFGKALGRHLPALYKHLRAQAIPMSFLCAEWFTTAYTRNTPLPLALCALDLFIVRLDDVMIRLGLAILEVLAPCLEALNARKILSQYGVLVANVPFKDVLRCALAAQRCHDSVEQTPGRGSSLGSNRESSCSLS